MTKPNLQDPAERAAYRRELMRLHRGWRLLGLAIVLAALVLLFARGGQFDMLTLSMLTLGWVILIGVIVKRTRYHRRRMREG